MRRLLLMFVLCITTWSYAHDDFIKNHKDFTANEMREFFVPDSSLLCKGNAKVISCLYDKNEELVGFGILSKELELEKRLNVSIPQEGVKIYERKIGTYWTEDWRGTLKLECSLIGYHDTSDAFLFSSPAEDGFVNTYANVTQTLFNEDEAYEMIQPVYGESRRVSYDENFERRYIYVNCSITRFDVVNENGEVQHSIKPKNGFYFEEKASVVKLGNKYYFIVLMCDMASEEAPIFRFYEINKDTNSIILVRELRNKQR